ncbi:MAG: amp-dependent synthetase and ligase [Bacteroidetes bacterium]|nr:MAG: amp-dependent synthetase and ligase [Bacteroidota bacterium]
MEKGANVTDLFFMRADDHPKRPAIIDRDGTTISFGKLAHDVKETADYYASRGIGKGDRVLIFIPMSIDLYRDVLALFHLGATAVFLDEWVSKERLELCCRIAGCKGFIAGWKVRLLSIFSRELRRIPVKLGPGWSFVNHPQMNKTTADDTALITFTTGSTGTPKAAKRTHGFLQAQFDALVDKIQPKADDIDMPVLPIVLLLNLGTGVPSVIADYKSNKPGELDPGKIMEQIKTHKVNRLTASPFFIRKLSEFVIQHKLELPQVRGMFTGGAPVFPDEAALYVRAFPGCNTTVVYGSTEAEPISSISAGELAQQSLDLQSGLDVGPAYHGTQVKIIPVTEDILQFTSLAELDAFCLPPGSIGEILVSGRHVLREYVNNPEALKRNKIFIGGEAWHRTGDAGFTDPAGHLRLCGRCSTMILKKDGSYLSPFLYENYFQQMDGVNAGTVLLHKNKITAILETAAGTDQQATRTKLAAEDHGLEEIIFVKQIPRDPRHNSKIDYGKLKELL